MSESKQDETGDPQSRPAVAHSMGLGGDSAPLSEVHLNLALEKTRPLDRWLDAGSDWLSAILVKETRQALKSRQFTWTFFLLLAVVTAWAIFAIAITRTTTGEFDSLGPVMLAGFLMILGFPLGIVIPYSTFRSIAQEYESQTLQMVSITTMRPLQIVLGKLGSSLLQMIMYLSVLAPCMAFTYLLRGVDLFQILLGLLVAVYGSVCLCCISLLLGCGMKRRAVGIGLSVLWIPVLALAYFFFCMFSVMICEPGGFFGIDEQIWSAVYTLCAIAGSTALIAFVAAMGMVAFDTENRATPLRVAVMIQQVVLVGLFVTQLLAEGGFDFVDDVAWSWSFAFGHYWLIVGSMLIAGSPLISRRVRRSFPQSLIGKALYALFMPGSGRAYLFAAGNLIAMMLTFPVLVAGFDYLAAFAGQVNERTLTLTEVQSIQLAMVVGLVYPLGYLSATFLICHAVKRRAPNMTPLFPLLISFLLVLATYLVGITLQYTIYEIYDNEYTLMQSFYWYSTGAELSRFGPATEASLGLMIVSIVTIALSLFSFSVARRDFSVGSLATPQRVLEEQNAIRQAKQREPTESIEDLFQDLPPQPGPDTDDSSQPHR